MSDDAQLIEQTLAGRSAAFGELVRKYQDRLFNSVVHVVGNFEDAKDIVQDAFVQAFVKLESFRQHAAFYTWLYRIAFNTAMSHRRARRPTVSMDQARECAGLEPADTNDGAETVLLRKEQRQQVREAIARIKDEYRAVVVLREIDGCCYETIAEILDLPIGTVRSRLYRGRMQLAEELKAVLAAGDALGR
ncbi:MAG: sigma-70 family RNA polymerase sigma factor [Patescibacteria group bacterium]|nr:sigma-70 family RNA polymerase sigma factor [Patescibacteria group bacterium]